MTEPKRNEIISRWRAGSSIRKIARELGMARNTVSGVLAEIEAQRTGHEGSPVRRRPSRLDPYEPFIQELLGRYPDLTAVRLLEELRERGFTGGYTMVRQRLGALRPRTAPLPVIRFETAPGAQAQMDYAVYDLDFTSEGRRRVNLFSYLLGYSRRQYLRFVESQDMTTTLREHLRAFEHLGGVAATCLYDNMKVVVTGYEDDVPVYNSRFLAFATHYGFRPVACRPRRPQTKGKVERPFYYVETSLFNGRTFSSLDHLNEMTAWWLANVADVRELREAKKTPLQLHAEEQPHLIPLPAQAYDVSPVVYRTVNVEALVTYCQNGYSVPWRYIGSMLPVRITEKELIVYGREVEEIARHVLLPRTVTGATGRAQRAPARRGCATTAGAVGGTVRRTGGAGLPIPGGFVPGSALRQGPGAAGAGPVGDLRPRGPDRGAGAGRAVRRVFPRGRGTHPIGPGPSQNHHRGAGRRRTAVAPLAG